MSWDGIHQLVLKARAGDADAWLRLHDVAGGYLLGLARRLIGPGWPHRTVSDLVSDTWQRAVQGFGSFRGGTCDAETAPMLRAWLGRIMRNAHRNDRRHAGAAPDVARLGGPGDSEADGGPAAADPTPSHLAQVCEQRARLASALARLPPDERAVVERHVAQGVSLKQVAAELGLSYDQARYRLHQGLGRLGRELGE